MAQLMKSPPPNARPLIVLNPAPLDILSKDLPFKLTYQVKAWN
jgi:hypothetical protein